MKGSEPMTVPSKISKHLRFWSMVLLSLLLIAVGICLIVSCIQIYQSGANPFTRARIGEQFSRISLLIYITLIAVVGCAVLHLFLPGEKKSPKVDTGAEETVSRLAPTVSLKLCGEQTGAAIQKERKLRKVLAIVNGVLYLAGIVAPMFYVLKKENFPAQQLTNEIATGFLIILAGLAIPFLFSVALLFVRKASFRREATLLKEAITEQVQAGTKPGRDKTKAEENKCRLHKKKYLLLTVRGVLIVCSVLFIVLGIFNGGMEAVVQKAIKICTECIGLG